MAEFSKDYLESIVPIQEASRLKITNEMRMKENIKDLRSIITDLAAIAAGKIAHADNTLEELESLVDDIKAVVKNIQDDKKQERIKLGHIVEKE